MSFETSVTENNQGKREKDLEIVDVGADILTRAGGHPGAGKVLKMIQENLGEEAYRKLAPNLGKKEEIWIKFSDECHKDLGDLVLKYGNIGEDSGN